MRIGLLGCGTVGSALMALLASERDWLHERVGEELEVARILVRDPARDRGPYVDRALLTTSAEAIWSDPEIEVVVELLGPDPLARRAIVAALEAGKSVVTANKELLSTDFQVLSTLAASVGRDIFFEAAVAGGIPLVRALRVSLLGERISRVVGIINGTTNFILTRMQDHGEGFLDALSEARRLGYAEADPSGDISGRDAASKLAIIASIAFGLEVSVDDVRVEGIEGLTEADARFAERNGQVIKLLATAERTADEQGPLVHVEVAPALVDRSHPLAHVGGPDNAVYLQGGAVGQLLFQGPGAGGMPTASAVLADVIDASRNLRAGVCARALVADRGRLGGSDRKRRRFAISLDVEDRPGVLATVSQVFGRHGVSIARMEQEEMSEDSAHLVFLTHDTTLATIDATLGDVGELPVVRALHALIRVLA
jgi:homoserine dehydrogenase